MLKACIVSRWHRLTLQLAYVFMVQNHLPQEKFITIRSNRTSLFPANQHKQAINSHSSAAWISSRKSRLGMALKSALSFSKCHPWFNPPSILSTFKIGRILSRQSIAAAFTRPTQQLYYRPLFQKCPISDAERVLIKLTFYHNCNVASLSWCIQKIKHPISDCLHYKHVYMVKNVERMWQF